MDISQIRARSKALFGAQYRLEVGAAIAEGDGIVCLKDLALELGDPPGTASVSAELRVLENSDLLRRAERRAGDRRVYLIRQESLYWQFCLEVRSEVGTQPAVEASQGLAARRERGE